jgi:fido (protein-threonine AMPylation protein)
MPVHTWKPLEPLTEADHSIDLSGVQALYESWHQVQAKLRANNPEGLARFTERLSRRLSVETGILERVYDLDRGTTESLVEQGFIEDLVAHSSTDIEPGRLINILRDQDGATQLIIDCIAGNRPISVGFANELHAVLMRHIHTATAVDQFGNRRDIPLKKGAFKEYPNNPLQTDGTLHEYCPPTQVRPEMERLFDFLQAYTHNDPILVAAWLHHRFTQIHPYQDGNGRVGRALTTLVLLKADLFPLVIDRKMRGTYFDALQEADRGDLTPLAQMFGKLEQDAILSALSIEVEAKIKEEEVLSSAVLSNLQAKFSRRQFLRREELLKANHVAKELRARGKEVADRVFSDFAELLRSVGSPRHYVQVGGSDAGNKHWFKYEVVKAASEAGKWANYEEDHYFINAKIQIDNERLVFVTSFHHVGHELSGVMEATAFARLETLDDEDGTETVKQEFFICSLQPFVFTNNSSPSALFDGFEQWMDAAIAVAIKEYGDRL